jgi:DNA invertase Pin-like site-specific DNA recombinase
MAQFAEFERERIAERLQCGMAAKKARGGFGGGRRPFGYTIVGKGRDSVLVPDPTEQKAIEAMRIASAVDGLGTRAISAMVKAQYQLDVSHVTVAKILKEAKS